MKRVSYLTFAFWIIWSIIVGVCAFFIVWNAQWGIGDDAIIMRHTGSGIPFTPRDTTLPSIGRFYPFSYLVYDLLLPFTNGYVSASAHYLIHVIVFVLMSFSFAFLFSEMFEAEKPIWRFVLSLSATLLIVFRLYSDYVNCFSTIWFSYSLTGGFVLFLWLYDKHKKTVFAILSLLITNYLVYCSEVYFVIPFSIGLGGILFHHKRNKKESWFYYSLLGSGVLYLILYGILVLPYIDSAYDGSHGASVSLISNAIHQLIANKILLVAIVVVIFRIRVIFKDRDNYSFYDNMLLAAIGYCAACFVLRLNWTMYYNIAAILAFPAVVYYCHLYFKNPITLIILLSLCCLYGYKLPRRIAANQQGRVKVAQQMDYVKNAFVDGVKFIWYAPEFEYCYNVERRKWKELSLCTYIQWLTHDPTFDFETRVSFSEEEKGIWFVPDENKLFFPDDSGPSLLGERCFDAGEIVGYMIE